MPRILGDSIILREYQSSDLPYIRNWVNDPEIVDNLSDIFLYPHTEQATEQFLNAMLDNNNVHQRGFVIAHKETEEYIGQIDLFKLDWKNRSAGLGIVLGNREHLGKGYGSQAIKLLQEFAFNRMNLHRLQLEVFDFNQRAYHCYLKCGFKEEGRLREKHFIQGRYADMIVMGILKSEYVERKK
ncbi:GNAT family N-acetyltransferase [Paenibacillus physcomitrellae]|uniref:N-acetyltransferase n=1 Tax=Paenibacillus physcomitrellae TaxID=1619311 RepID=A0ABQ1FZ58_9BACL|nr:GNAT family protein [Paenibacillus physcomitrellae]GGA33521.1 N-acetyltransferase [Paenibacillus physcomitrellae]